MKQKTASKLYPLCRYWKNSRYTLPKNNYHCND